MPISPLKVTPSIKVGLVQPFTFQNYGWCQSNDPRYDQKFMFLSQFCVAVKGIYYVKDSINLSWHGYENKQMAVAAIYQQRAGTVQFQGASLIVGMDDIKRYFQIGMPMFDGLTYAPMCPEFVWFAGERRLNLWKDERVEGDTDDIVVLEEFLKVLRNGVCAAEDEIGLGEMIDEINSKTASPFRWLIHWLAVRYQCPGYTPQTNVWFVGKKRGVGKGSLMSVMRQIMGPKSVGKVSEEDMARGWTGSVFGCDLVEWDEFKGKGWHDFNRLIKRVTGNESFSVTLRNIGDKLQPNCGMHVFQTNDMRPIVVEKEDRQNTFIQTTNEDEWADRAKAMWDQKTNTLLEPRIVTGFAALLNEINIDYGFIRKPLKTELGREMADDFDDDTVEIWWQAMHNEIPWQKPSWEQLHGEYGDYCQRHLAVKALPIKFFRREMIKKGYANSATMPTKDGTGRAYRAVTVYSPKVVKIAS